MLNQMSFQDFRDSLQRLRKDEEVEFHWGEGPAHVYAR